MSALIIAAQARIVAACALAASKYEATSKVPTRAKAALRILVHLRRSKVAPTQLRSRARARRGFGENALWLEMADAITRRVCGAREAHRGGRKGAARKNAGGRALERMGLVGVCRRTSGGELDRATTSSNDGAAVCYERRPERRPSRNAALAQSERRHKKRRRARDSLPRARRP
jgi:hypothetical protein